MAVGKGSSWALLVLDGIDAGSEVRPGGEASARTDVVSSIIVEEPPSTGCSFDERGGPTIIETVGNRFADELLRESADDHVGDESDSAMILDAGASKADVVLPPEFRLGKRTRNLSSWQLPRICGNLP